MVIVTKRVFTEMISVIYAYVIIQLKMMILNFLSIAIVEWGTTNWGRKLIGKLPRLHRVITGSNPVASTKFVLSYTPQELGFNFPEIKQINIDHCTIPQIGLTKKEYGHTHIFPYDGNVCVWSEYLFDEYDNPSETMWHEYAHVLTRGGGHSKEWAELLKSWGKKHLAQPYGYWSDWADTFGNLSKTYTTSFSSVTITTNVEESYNDSTK